MLISHNREKLINAIIFFATRTRWCGKTKLFKLLYFLDFEHFKQTGRSITGLEYYAWPMGPVPIALYGEFDAPEPDMAAGVRFEEVRVKRGDMISVKPIADFDSSHFAPRELKIMEGLAKEYKDTVADEIIEATHLESLPWHRVYKKEGHQQALIPYEYALNKQEQEAMKDVIRERREITDNYE